MLLILGTPFGRGLGSLCLGMFKRVCLRERLDLLPATSAICVTIVL